MAQQYGLLRIASNEDLKKEEDSKRSAENREIDLVETQLSAHIQKAWEINRWAKEEIEDEMLTCLRQRNGEYDTKTLQDIRNQGGSEIYMMLTATKIRAAVSWLTDILIPSNDKPWGLNPTPIPELPQFAMSAIAKRIQQTMPPPEQLEDPSVIDERAGMMRDEVMNAMRNIAADAAKRMESTIEDQMEEGAFSDALVEFIDDFATFPAAIMKGPVIKKKKSLRWSPKTHEPEVSDEVFLEFKRVSPFDLYPSPDSSNVDDGDIIERIKFSRKSLYNSIGLPGYNSEAIRAVLQEYGRQGLRDWLWRDYERAHLENKDRFWMRQDQKTIDGLHYWGNAQGLSLLEWGMSPDEIKDPLAEYEIEAIKIGRHVIRAVINKDPLHRRPYRKASYQTTPGGFWGIALPRLMRDHQRMCNATARALANNLGIASGPMVEVEVDRLADGEEVTQLYPWQIIQTKSDKTGRGREAVRFFQPKSFSQELMAVYENFERRADDATSIPRYAYGNERVGGAGNTASGLSMLMSNASKGIKLAVSNIDVRVIKPTVEHVFTFNMLWNPDKSIKGDVDIVARGATAMLTREATQMRRAEFLQMTANPIDMEIMGVEGRIEVLRSNADLLDLNTDNIVPDRETWIANQKKKQQEGEDEPPPPELLKLQQQAQIEKAKLEQDMVQFEQKLRAEKEMTQEKMDAELEKNRQKLETEYRFKMEELRQESEQNELDRQIEREKEAASREAEIQQIKEKVKADREAASEKEKAEKPEPSEQESTIVNLHVDARQGAVQKKITLDTSGDRITGGTVIETPVEEK